MSGAESASTSPPPNGKGNDPLSAVVEEIKRLNAELQKVCDYVQRELLPKPEKLEEARVLIIELVEYVQREVIDRKEWFRGLAAPTDRAAIVVNFGTLKTAALEVHLKLQSYELVLRHHHNSSSRLSGLTTKRFRKEVRAMEKEGRRAAGSVRSFVDEWVVLTQNIVASRASRPG
jgi:hypothetical protein